MKKETRDFYLRRIKYLEDEIKNNEEKIRNLNCYIQHLEDKYTDIIKMINDDIGQEFYINLDYDARILYRIREILGWGEDDD